MLKLTKLTTFFMLMVTVAAAKETMKENSGEYEFDENHSGRWLQSESEVPSMAPFSCSQEWSDEFFVKETESGQVVTKTCRWLSKLKKIKFRKRLCKKDASNDEYGSAMDVCPITCKRCPKPKPPPTACEEDDDTNFQFYRVKNTCGWLKDQPERRRKKMCKKIKPKGELLPPWRACPITCWTCKPPAVPSVSPSPTIYKAPFVCSEEENAEFGFITKSGREVKGTCGELRKKSEKIIKMSCLAKKAIDGYDLPGEVCLVTCKACGGK